MTKEEILNEIQKLEAEFTHLKAEHDYIEHMIQLIPSHECSKADELGSYVHRLQNELNCKMMRYHHRCDILEAEVQRLEAAAA